MSIEEIKQKLDRLRTGKMIEYYNPLNLATDWMASYRNDVTFLLEQNQRLREERDSFQRVGIKVQEVNVRLVEALEKCREFGECQLDYGGSLDALEQVVTISNEALQAYKLLEKKD